MRKIDAFYVVEKTRKRFTSECSVLKIELKALLDTLKQNVNTIYKYKKMYTNEISIGIHFQEVNFIRCIKPNDIQRSDLFDKSFVKIQLENTGTAYLVNNSDNVKKRRCFVNLL